MIKIPERVPGLKWLTVVWGVYGVLWIAPEGVLWQALLLGVGTTAVLILHLGQKYLGGRALAVGPWLGMTAVSGLCLGAGSGLLTLFFMAMKTGLHAHGPEFSLEEINWVMGRTPLWALVGLLSGLGLGLLAWGAGASQARPDG